MKRLFEMSGWIAASALAATWLLTNAVRDTQRDGQSGAKIGPEPATEAAAAPAEDTAYPETAAADADAGTGAAAGAVRGDDWRPPRNDFEALVLQMTDATAAERALVNRITAAMNARNPSDLAALAREAALCPNPVARAIAAQSLLVLISQGRGLTEDQKCDLVSALLEFRDDECEAVRCAAISSFIWSLDEVSHPAVFEMGLKAADAIGENKGDFNMPSLIRGMFRGFEAGGEFSPDEYDKALTSFWELSKSDSPIRREIGEYALRQMASGGCFPRTLLSTRYPYSRTAQELYHQGGSDKTQLPDEAALDKMSAEYRSFYDYAKTRFPDNSTRTAKAFLATAIGIRREATRRYGDTPKAEEWCREDLAHLEGELKAEQ